MGRTHTPRREAVPVYTPHCGPPHPNGRLGGVLTDPVTKETTRHQQLGANPGGMLFLRRARSQAVRGGSCNALVKGSCRENPNPSAAPGPWPCEVTDSGVGSRCGHPRGGCYSVCEVSHVV